jgi:hypothetical protein
MTLVRVTFATMAHTDGKATHYNVYQGNLRKDGTIHFGKNTKMVGSIYDAKGTFCYRCTEEHYAGYAKGAAPPVPWQSHNHTCNSSPQAQGEEGDHE